MANALPLVVLLVVAGCAALASATSYTAGDSADQSGMESEWVLHGKSDIVPAAAGHDDLNLSPLPIWAQMVQYEVAKKVEGETLANVGETLANVQTAVKIVEHVAEVTAKFAAFAANSLPEKEPLHEVAVEIEHIAGVVCKAAHKVEAIINKIQTMCPGQGSGGGAGPEGSHSGGAWLETAAARS